MPPATDFVIDPIEHNPDARKWGMRCHLAALGCLIVPVIGSIGGPFVIWRMRRQTQPFVDRQGREALNFHISIALYMIPSAILLAIGLGVFLLAALYIFALVMTVVAALKAGRGETHRYPLAIRFLK